MKINKIRFGAFVESRVLNRWHHRFLCGISTPKETVKFENGRHPCTANMLSYTRFLKKMFYSAEQVNQSEQTGWERRQRGNTMWNPAQGIRTLKRLKSSEKIGSGRIVTQLSLFPSGVIELKGKMVVGEEWGGWVEGWRWWWRAA